jgi:hypothetical protein
LHQRQLKVGILRQEVLALIVLSFSFLLDFLRKERESISLKTGGKMKRSFEFIGMVVGTILIVQPAIADTNVSGVISTNTVWNTAGSPYIVTGDVLVDTSVRLDIQPGVEVRIDQGKHIMIKGTFSAIGTATDSIMITKNGTAEWSRLWFKSTSRCSLEYCRVEYANNSAIYNENADSLYIGYCTICNNSRSGVFNHSGSATITDNAISNNSAYSGSGIYNGGIATITNNTISYNLASNTGGGIYNYGTGTATITNNTISYNSASLEGGGVCVYGSAIMTNNTISNDSARYGGGICVYGSVTITNNTISYNSASLKGGGIFNYSGSAVITNNAISCNLAFLEGGGVFNYSDGATITNNTISYNLASNNGGGVCNSFGFATIKYNSITDTTSSAIYIKGGSPLVRTNNIYATGYAVYNGDTNSTDARYNWWNTVNTDTIDAKIFDYYDDSSKGIVYYRLFLSEAFSDTVTPTAPLNLTANGSNPSPVTSDSIFVIDWINPSDPSGISEYHYKLGSEPISDFDTTGTFHSAPDTVFSIGEELCVWLVDSSGNLNYQNGASVMLYVGIEENVVPPQRGVASLQILKNPFVKSTVIRYSLPEYTDTRLTVYDLSGREMRELVNGKQTAGSHEFSFEGRGLTTGAYFLVLNAGENKLTRKIILTK